VSTCPEQLRVWLLGDPLPCGVVSQIQHGCQDDMRNWKRDQIYVSRDTCEQAPLHEVPTQDKGKRAIGTLVVEIKSSFHIGDSPPEHETTDGHQVGNMCEKMRPLQQKDICSKDPLGKDGPNSGYFHHVD
jgi:hypothetical protein